LEGGIINYAKEVEENNLESKFIGKNFVFDDRLGERITEDIVSKCHQCSQPQIHILTAKMTLAICSLSNAKNVQLNMMVVAQPNVKPSITCLQKNKKNCEKENKME
jgi:predicted sulfurtransferase